MIKKYIVTLTDSERKTLQALISKGKGAARRLIHARILLKADRGLPDPVIVDEVEISRPTIERVRVNLRTVMHHVFTAKMHHTIA